MTCKEEVVSHKDKLEKKIPRGGDIPQNQFSPHWPKQTSPNNKTKHPQKAHLAGASVVTPPPKDKL